MTNPPSEGRSRVYLSGFMAAGKSTVGRHLAELLGWSFVDLDRRIELAAGPIAEIFRTRGEEAFRQLERVELIATLDRSEVVVATGGGTLVTPENRRLIGGRGLTVWIKPSFGLLAERLERKRGVRPLFRSREQALALYRSRMRSYRECDLIVPVGRRDAPQQVAARIAAALRRP